MSTYVLVHGSWHGAWCWEEVIPLLQKQNHQVYAPDLPGHGEDKTPIKKINFGSYVACISQILNRIDEPVILVGHSMAGMVISQVAQHFPNKIKQLVYLAAFLPQDGESLFTIAQKQPPTAITQAMQSVPKDNALIFPLSYIQPFAYHRCTDALIAKLMPRFCVEPLAPSATPVSVNKALFDQVKRVYIECTDDQAITLDSQRRMQRETPCLTYRLDCDHSPFYSDPKGLVEILTDLE